MNDIKMMKEFATENTIVLMDDYRTGVAGNSEVKKGIEAMSDIFEVKVKYDIHPLQHHGTHPDWNFQSTHEKYHHMYANNVFISGKYKYEDIFIW